MWLSKKTWQWLVSALKKRDTTTTATTPSTGPNKPRTTSDDSTSETTPGISWLITVMAETLPDVKALIGFHACDRCGPSIRSYEMWSARDGDLLLSFCQSHADRFAVPLWDQGFRPIMKAPVPT